MILIVYRSALFIVPRVDGVVSAFEASTGKPLWNFSTGGPLVQTSTPSSSDPALSPSEMMLFQTIQRDGLQVLMKTIISIKAQGLITSYSGILS